MVANLKVLENFKYVKIAFCSNQKFFLQKSFGQCVDPREKVKTNRLWMLYVLSCTILSTLLYVNLEKENEILLCYSISNSVF